MRPQFDWRHYLYLADDLIGFGDKSYCDEAKDRTAISRAYYAAYNLAFDHIKAVDGAYIRGLRGDVGHGDISGWYEAQPPSKRQLRKVGGHLVRLCSKRHAADYANQLEDNPELPLECAAMASQVVKILNEAA